jgi:hypothetical protein
MQNNPLQFRLAFTAALAALALAAIGCTTTKMVQTGPPTIPATVGNGYSPGGISGPGPDSEDTRGAGGVALGEGAGIPDGPGTQPGGGGAGAGTLPGGERGH